MKIKHLPLILSSAAIVLFSSYAMMYPGGSPTAKTGSPGDGANCAQCHGGTATTTVGLITSNIPVSGYVPGQTYQITATNPQTGSGKIGFEVSPQNAAGTQLGTLVAGTGSKLVGGTKYVTQSNANSTTNTWTFGWIAPAAGTGAVTFYGAFARNYTGVTTLSTLTVQEVITTGIDKNIATASLTARQVNGFISVGLNMSAGQAKISVFDISGRQLYNSTISGSGTQQIDQQFKPGVYIILVKAGATVLKRKIMVN